jgi:hypothetical protein
VLFDSLVVVGIAAGNDCCLFACMHSKCPKVLIADLAASNGVVHIIDGVLFPDGSVPSPPPYVGTCTKAACYFSAITPYPGITPGGPFCGEVDAAPRMPADIWNDTKAVANYIELTLDFWEITAPGYPSFLHALVQGRCGRNNNQDPKFAGDFRGWTVPAGGKNISSWAEIELMRAVCSGDDPKFGPGCGCDYPHCPDQPDDPGHNRFCSLCGPRFNAPIEIRLFKCAGHPNGRPVQCVTT